MFASYIDEHGGPEVLQLGELAAPEPGPGEVRISVKASALNHLDLWVRRGMKGLNLEFPHVLGGDAAGRVDCLGAGGTGFEIGDSVVIHPGLSCGACESCLTGWETLCSEYKILGEHVNGTHAQQVCVPARNLFPIPNKLTFEEAAALPLVFTTAWQMLVRRAKVQPGDTVLVHAAGSGVGSAAIQIAKLFKARVIATASGPEKLKLAQRLGADDGIDYSKEDLVKRVRQIQSRGADIIVDHLGQDFWEKNIRAVRAGGTIVVCGSTSGYEGITDLRHLFSRQLNLLGSTMGSKGDFARILKHVAAGELRPVVDCVFPLKKAVEAHRRMEQRTQFGKIVLVP